MHPQARWFPVLSTVMSILILACDTSVPRSSATVAPPGATAAITGTTASSRAPSPTASRTTAPAETPTPSPPPNSLAALTHCTGRPASANRGSSVERGSTWSGYVAAQPPASFSCVEAGWVEPEITCGAGDSAVGIWVGIGGYTSVDLGIFDDGRALERAGTGVDCESGSAKHYAWHQAEPHDASDQPFSPDPTQHGEMVIGAGDRIWAQVRYGDGAYQMTVANLSTEEARSSSQASTGNRRSSAEWVVSGEEGEALARFSVVTFTGGLSTMAGEAGAIGSASWRRNEVDEWSGGFRRLRVSALSADNASFRVTWLHR